MYTGHMCFVSNKHQTGAYDTGMIRTWSIQSYSLVTLKGLLNKYLASIAPLEDDEDSDFEDAIHTHKPLTGEFVHSFISHAITKKFYISCIGYRS